MQKTQKRNRRYILCNADFVFQEHSPCVKRNDTQDKLMGLLLYCCVFSDVETEVHYIAVLHKIILAFDAHLAGFFARCFAFEAYIVVVLYHLGSYETFFKV